MHIVTHAAAGSRGLAAAAADRRAHRPPALARARCSPWSACRCSPRLCLAADGLAVHRAPGLPPAGARRRPGRRPVARRWGPRCSADWWRTGSSSPPTGQLTVHQIDDVVALLGGLVVAVAVATVVDRSARRATAAARSQAETAMLASLARSVLAGDRGLPSLLEQIREAFGLRSVTMVERTDDGERTVGTCGRPGPGDDESRDRRDHRHPRAAAARTDPARERAAGARGLRRAGRRRAAAGPAGGAGRRGRAAGGRQQHAHRPARRRQPRPAHPAGRHQGGRVGAALATTSTSIDADRAELHGDHRRVGRPAHRSGRQPAGHEPAAGRGGQPGAEPLRRAGRRAPARSAGWTEPTAPVSRWTGRSTCRPSWPIPDCSSGWSPTWWATPSAMRRPVR